MWYGRLWAHHWSAWSDTKLLDLSNPDKQMSDVCSLRKDGKGSRTRSANGLAQSPPLWDRNLSCTRYLNGLHRLHDAFMNINCILLSILDSYTRVHRGRSCRKLRKPFWVKDYTLQYCNASIKLFVADFSAWKRIEIHFSLGIIAASSGYPLQMKYTWSSAQLLFSWLQSPPQAKQVTANVP